MKRLIFIMTILLTTFTKSFSYTEIIVDGIKYFINDNNVSLTVRANNYSGDLVIPELVTYNNKKYIVNGVYYYAFKDCPSLKSITLPPTISYFFTYDTSLQGTDSLKRIYMSSPVNWSKCNFSKIPKDCILYVDGNPFVGDVTFNTDINENCFNGYNHFTSVTIENGCTSIGAEAFQGCNKLKKVRFANTVDNKSVYYSIGQNAFPRLGEVYVDATVSLQGTYSTNVIETSFLCGGDGIGRSEYTGLTVKVDTIVSFWSNTKGWSIGVGDGCDGFSYFDYCKNNANVAIYTPSICHMGYPKYISNAIRYQTTNFITGTGKKIYLCDTLSVHFSEFNNCYFWCKEKIKIKGNLVTTIKTAIDASQNICDFTSFPTKNKFTYSGKSPLETISFVNNTDAIDVKMDSTKFGVNVGEYSGIPFIASLKDWSCDLTWPYDYTIEKTPLTIMGNTITKEYGQPIPELSCTYIGLVNGETKEVLTTPVQIITTATEESPVGTYSIIPSNATSNNYDITFERGILNIIPASQSINWEQEFSKAKIGDIIELSATSSSGLKVSFSSSNPSVVDIYSSNGKWYAECIAAGNVRISAIQAGNNNYNAADDIVKRISVTDTDTSIGTVEIKSNTNRQIYDIEGRKRDRLKKGINIVDGKKVLIK